MDVGIRIAPDRLTAVLDLPAGTSVDVATLKLLLQRTGVCQGLDREALVAATRAENHDRVLLVAHVDATIAGTIDPPLTESKLPRRVAVGEQLGQVRYAERATTGVDGQPIQPVHVAPVLGRGLALTADGAVQVTRDGLLTADAHGVCSVPLSGCDERELAPVTIAIDSKGHEATLMLKAGEWVAGPALATALATAGVTTGIDASACAQATVAEAGERRLVLAHAIPPSHGVDGHLERFIDDRLHVIVDAHGHADFRDHGKAHEVRAGAVLARIHAPTEGTPGTSVRGAPLPAKPGHPFDPARAIGNGTQAGAQDPHQIEATIDGVYRRDRSGRLEVHPLLIVEGDVDMRCGNIDTTLSVRIQGDIKNGFSVKSSADIEVMGAIEDARVSAKGDLLVRGGILPGRNRVKAHGGVTARHINGREVKGHDIHVAGGIHSSQVLATGEVVAQEIRASRVIAAGSVTCDSLGGAGVNGEGLSTEIQVGINPFEEVLFQTARDHHQRLSDEVVQLKERCKLIGHQLKVRGQNEGANAIADEFRQTLAEFSDACTRLASCEAILQRHQDRSEQDNRGVGVVQVAIKRTAHAGVAIRFGEIASLQLTQPLAMPRFRLVDGTVVW